MFEKWFAQFGMTLLLWLGNRANIAPETLKEIQVVRTSMYLNWPKSEPVKSDGLRSEGAPV